MGDMWSAVNQTFLPQNWHLDCLNFAGLYKGPYHFYFGFIGLKGKQTSLWIAPIHITTNLSSLRVGIDYANLIITAPPPPPFWHCPYHNMCKSVRNKAVYFVLAAFVCLQQRETHLYWSGWDRLWESAAYDILRAESEEKTRGPMH